MSANFSDNFIIASLPRQALLADSSASKFCVASPLANEAYGKIDLAISGSFIATYIQRPTPRMVWSEAIAPQAKVTSIAVYNKDFSDEQVNFAVGITERKKSCVRLITRRKASSEDLDSASGDQKSFVIPTEKPAVELRFSKDGEVVFCLFQDSTTAVIPFGTDIMPELEYSGDLLKQSYFHSFLDARLVGGINSDTSAEGFFLYVGKNSRGSSFDVKLYALVDRECLEILSTDLQIEIAKPKFLFNAPGTLIALDEEGKTMQTYTFPSLKPRKSIDLRGIIAKNGEVSVVSVAPNRIAISSGSSVFLVDVLHEAVMASYEMVSPAKAEFTTVELIESAFVKGNSQSSKNTFLLVVVKNSRDNTATLQNLKVDVGLGRLRDVLGNSTLKFNRERSLKSQLNGIPRVMDVIKSNSFESEEAVNKSELLGLLEYLSKTYKEGNYESFDSAFVSFMKGESLATVSQNGNAKKVKKVNNFSRVYEIDHDRVVDHTFVHLVVDMLLGSPTSEALEAESVPIESLTYLLTHPLFPTDYAKVVLKKLAAYPILTRQAVVTCPNIPCIDLIHELSVIDNDDIFKDVLIRLVEEFSSDRITQETIRLSNTASETGGPSFDLDKIIRKIIKLNFGFEILNSFIDSNGLILSLQYSSDADRLSKLLSRVDKQVDSLVSDSQLLTIVNKCIHAVSLEAKKSRKKKNGLPVEEDNISAVLDQAKIRVDSMLPITEASAGRGRDDELLKKVPVYSLERLTL
ncbi:unnamed protein product [Kuraishia capsulata CBS 1993]|uniref:U3 small nucleolar RNA-associated protein 8 n=1 Tax=Kuraishia capsulata CBS 1993 TaxID=1382522 RepID=W6MKQ6_9ASCO|nr:uncharacterized protein KUCA_T00002581001 [Kuraishia capsulata CBS 1993]CDK26608.1 unnamed protein product [Kuraishia capsulata CBS 1993]